MRHWLRSFRLCLIASTLILVLVFTCASPAFSQFADLFNTGNDSIQRPSIPYIKRGNLHIASVRLDGAILFNVASSAVDDSGDSASISPIEWRVNEIEANLNQIVSIGFNPSQLTVVDNILNSQTVIFVETPAWRQQIMTVTELDRQIDKTSNSIEAIAQLRSDQIKQALLQAYTERQPNHILRLIIYSVLTLISVIVFGLFLRPLRKTLKQQRRYLNQQMAVVLADSLDGASKGVDMPQADQHSTTVSTAKNLLWIPKLPFLAYRSELTLDQQKNLNTLLHSLLLWLQVLVWVGSIIFILLLFPQTRRTGIWLIGVPLNLIIVLFSISLLKKAIDILVKYSLHRWSVQDGLDPKIENRIQLRIPTIANILQEVTLYGAIIAGTFIFLAAIQVPLTFVLAGLGIIGFSSQNLIKDWIGGALILWEDQYTQNDVVQIDDIAGLVEYMNLRITKLRTLDGELATITNGSFTKAVNLTHQWSRFNFGVEVAYDTNLDQAMTVIETVAEELAHDLDWQDIIIEPPVILGVDAFGDSSITIRLLIKTLPMKQWDVGREFRRRLKVMFDQAGISIPFPQRSIWLEKSEPEVRLDTSQKKE